MKRYRFLILNFLFLVPLHMHAQHPQAPHTIWLNVLIHGTIGLRSQLNLSTFIHLMKDDIENTTYKKVVTQIRNDPFFFKIQPIQDLGLHRIEVPCKKTCSASSLFAKVFDINLASPAGIQNNYYSYGWSGLLSITERYKDSQLLYKALQTEVEKIKYRHPQATVRIRLVGYSHGGSVALHLAQVQSATKKLIIDELLLVGTPIQKETDHLLHDPMFKKVYNFYSQKDTIQKMDCFSFKRFFSQRRFKKKCLCDKLVQVELKVMSHKYPGSHQYTINRSPSHTELWFFGWTLKSFREKFITYPLPFSAFLPNFMRIIESSMPDKKHVVLSVYPDGTALVRAKKSNHTYSAQWIDPEQLQMLQEDILSYAPTQLSVREYEEHVMNAQKSTEEGIKKLQEKHAKKYKKCQKHRRCLCGIGAYEAP